MREYLFDLRKKVNKSQAEIDKFFSEKYGIRLSYSAIEIGTAWKDLSVKNRASMLADALATTPEYILQMEETEGGYEGRDFRVGHANPHMVRKGRISAYDEPLTHEEKALAEQYIPYAEKIIDILRCNEYRSFLGKQMSYEDFYDIGMLAFLRSVKSLYAKKNAGDLFVESLDEPDYFYRYHFSRAIKGAYLHHLRAESTLQRKDYHKAVSTDSTISGKDGDETELYNFIPGHEIPVNIRAESSWFLHTLYAFLTENQISACKLLIAGYSPPDIVKGGYASERDIGIIRFYLNQCRTYGKILWNEDSYLNVAPNISYSFTKNKWDIKLSYNSKIYSLGSYADLNNALDVQAAMRFHIAKGDFLEWFDAHMMPNVYKGKAFTYPLPGDENFDYEIQNMADEKARQGGVDISTATKDTPYGISFISRRNAYEACIGHCKLGQYKTFDEALEIRQLAESHKKSGDFDAWYNNFKAEKAKAKIPYTRIDKRTKNNGVSYEVIRTYQKKTTRLGQYCSEQEALSVKALADSHIDKGDFDSWAKDFYGEYRAKLKGKGCITPSK